MKFIIILFITTIYTRALFAQTFESETDTLTKAPVVSPTKLSKEEKAKLPPPKPILPPNQMIPSNLIQLGKGKYFSKSAIMVDKQKRTLSLWIADENGVPTHINSFPSDHGRKEGDKIRLGDLRTPEGIYFFQEMYQGNQLNYDMYGKRAFTTNYPNYFDKKEKKTGSGIWLHSIPKTKTLYRGSRGCVVVRNEVIDYLKSHIKLKRTPIIIENSISYLSKDDFIKSRDNFNHWLSSWTNSWSNKNIDEYMSFYSDDFKSLQKKMNKRQWRSYKTILNEKYNFISVQADEPIIFIHKDHTSVSFIQNYQSDKIKDFGQKILHLKKDGNMYSILNETWTPAQPLPQDTPSSTQTLPQNGAAGSLVNTEDVSSSAQNSF
ncbi:MAG: L,D-transpeptidase family protein [Bdellovibrionaceae bacterium]|nr:L,D-transpeptidase family protein [Pseudobdellovibrionaceae bacterium]